MSAPIQIPVKPYVYKVLTSADFFGSNQVSLAKTDYLGSSVYRSLNVINYEAALDADLPAWFTNAEQHCIITIKPKFTVPDLSYNEYNYYSIALLFEEIVRTTFQSFMAGRMDKYPAERESIRRFRAIYNITEEEFTTTAFKKQIQRFRWRALDRIKKKPCP